MIDHSLKRMQDSYEAVQRALRKECSVKTVAEAQRILQRLGILDENNNITKEYEGILVKIDDKSPEP